MICGLLVLTLFYFNSIKVQLERVCPSAVLSSIALFQFHKGTIRTSREKVFYLFWIDFNSIKVQLELSGKVLAE